MFKKKQKKYIKKIPHYDGNKKKCNKHEKKEIFKTNTIYICLNKVITDCYDVENTLTNYGYFNSDRPYYHYNIISRHFGGTYTRTKTCVKLNGYKIVKTKKYIKHYKNGVLHRDNDMPAIIYMNGDYKYYKNGILHRDNNRPAVKTTGSDFIIFTWYKNGKMHRDNNYALAKYNKYVFCDFVLYWYKNGMIHNDGDEHAITSGQGYKAYYKYGYLHRDNYQPAVIVNGLQQYSLQTYKNKYYICGHNFTNDMDRYETCSNIYKKNIDKKNKKLAFKYFHIWYEKIYENVNSKFVQLQINKSYDELLAASELFLDSS